MAVEGGFTVICDVVSPPGLHKKLPPAKDGVADKTMLSPLQIVSLVLVSAGTGFTVTEELVGELEQPPNE